MDIRPVEKLHSADNPTEITDGFPVPGVEHQQTLREYLMSGADPHNDPFLHQNDSKNQGEDELSACFSC